MFMDQALCFDQLRGNGHGELKNGFVSYGRCLLRKEANLDSFFEIDAPTVRRRFA